MNYSTVFLIFLTLGFGAYALAIVRRAMTVYSQDYLRFFLIRLAADFVLTSTWSVLYLAGMPFYNVQDSNHGTVLLASLFLIGATCLFLATYAHVALIFALARIHLKRQFLLAYSLLTFGIVGITVMVVVSGSFEPSLAEDQGMLAFAIISRVIALVSSVVLVSRFGRAGRRRVRKTILYAGYFFIAIDASWLALYVAGSMGLLPAWLYDGLHLSRQLFLNAVVALYLGRFLDAFEGSNIRAVTGDRLNQHLVTKYGISRREEEVILHLCQGRSNQEIAEKLFISERTVKGHLYNIFLKTKVKSRVQLSNLFAE